MNPYSSYKDSGVEWIGEIPSDWINTKIKYVGDYINGFPFKPSQWGEKGRLIIRIQNLTKGNSTENYFDGELEDRYIIKKGDLLFSWSTTLGLFEWDREDGLLNQHIFKVVLNNIYIKGYFIHLFSPVVNYLQSQSHGSTMTHLTKDNFGRVELPLPPLPEQTQIVSFLDTKTQKIDELIQKTEQKIKLLKEKRTSLINHCVTKGLNPNVEMKDSGVEWIGEIPNHWGTTKLKYQGDVIIGLSYKPENQVDEGQGILVMRSSNVQNGKPSFKDNVYVDCEISEKLKIKENDILICSRNGSRRLIGKNCLIPKEIEGMTWGVFMTVYRSKSPKFFHWLLNSPVFESQSGLFLTSTINQLTVSTLQNMVVPYVYELEEQNQIIEYLNEQTQKIDSTIEKETQRIELLKEYRQSLISEVVTGKVDVRDWKN